MPTRRGVAVSTVEAIIATEDREIFSNKLREIGEKIAQGYPAVSVDEAVAAAEKIGDAHMYSA